MVAIGRQGPRPEVHREVDDQVYLLVQQEGSYVVGGDTLPGPFGVACIVKRPLDCLYLQGSMIREKSKGWGRGGRDGGRNGRQRSKQKEALDRLQGQNVLPNA